MNDNDERNARQYVYYPLFSNGDNSDIGRRPMTMALKQNAPRCLEIML